MKQIITSILDTDLYKISMGQFVKHFHPSANVKYEFKCRNDDIKLGFLKEQIVSQIELMRNIRLTQEEFEYLSTLKFLSSDYVDYLSSYCFNPDCLSVCDKGGNLEIIINGLWYETILWEVPLLATINELYFQNTSSFNNVEIEGVKRLEDKIDIILKYPQFKLAEFGTRRRYSKFWQNYVLEQLCKRVPFNLVGTSNLYLSKKYQIKPIGTMAHEVFSAYLAFADNIRNAQKMALHDWLAEYDTPHGPQLGIALTDTFGSKSFFEDFNSVLANSYDGVRHDSGDAVEFAKRVIEHYKKIGIDPRTKSLVFSDGLTVESALRLFEQFTGQIGLSFGIGTSLTNDLSVKPLNIVIKLLECNGVPVVKISDEPLKSMGDAEMVKRVKNVYGCI